MRPVGREEILDLQTYEEQRPAIRAHAMKVKGRRRVHVGDFLTFLFENRDTVRYQVLEMVRVERMVREDQIRHELETYNELLGGEGEIGCTLLIEIDDPEIRRERLRAWRDLPEYLYVRLQDGRLVRPAFDERQRDLERLSAVQFLTFDTGGEVPVAVGSDLEGLTVEAVLTEDQRSALAEDLRDPDPGPGPVPGS